MASPVDPPPAKTFAAIVGETSSSSISRKVPGKYRGEPAIFFTEYEISKLASPLKFARIGKFSHGRPSITEIRSSIDSIGLKAAYTVGVIDHKHFCSDFIMRKIIKGFG